jgi:hypothetical protein
MEDRAKKNAQKDKYGASNAYDHDEVVLFGEAAEDEFGGAEYEDEDEEEYEEVYIEQY